MVQTTICTPYTIYRAVGETQTQHIAPQYREYTQFSILPPIAYIYIDCIHIYTQRGRVYRGYIPPPPRLFIAYIIIHNETTWLSSAFLPSSFSFPISQTFVNKENDKEKKSCQCPLPNQNKKSKKNTPPSLKKFSKKIFCKKICKKMCS